MANKKITELLSITGANLANTDEFVVVDISEDETKSITKEELTSGIVTTAAVTTSGALMDSELTDIAAVKAIDQGLTTTSSPTFNAGTFTTVNSSGGDLNLDTLDLNAIAASKAVTARDVFVYDTSKDTDGGAWRKRTQGTSWYNEALNTATRGSRREFPSVAVIVAEVGKVTIYDGDDPAMPMWIVANRSVNNFWNWISYGNTSDTTSVNMLNGVLSIGSSGITDTRAGLTVADFICDKAKRYRTAGGIALGSIAERNTQIPNLVDASIPSLVSPFVNDVAMTVLPDAPIDYATGLQIPTIAVATGAGVSVIKDDGTVVDLTTTSAAIAFRVYFTDDNKLAYVYGEATAGVRVDSIPDSDFDIGANKTDKFNSEEYYIIGSLKASGWESSDPYILGASQGGSAAISAYSGIVAFGEEAGLTSILRNTAATSTGMVAYTASTYTSGWMPGNIKGAFLADTATASLVASGELVTNGTFGTDTTGWVADANASLSVVSNALRVTANADGTAIATHTVTGLVVGKQYVLTFDFVEDTQSTGDPFYGFVVSGLPMPASAGKVVAYVTPSNTTYPLQIGLGGAALAGEYVTIDNISVKLADADRSVNNKGLVVNGTITRTPVATGAELVGYSGFSASNFLEQPYNAGLDFGTSDFSIMGWVKRSSAVPGVYFERDLVSRPRTSAISLIDQGPTNIINCYFGSTGTLLESDARLAVNVWQFVCVFVSGGVSATSIDGVISSNKSTAGSVTNIDAVSRVGIATNNVLHSYAHSMALWRISATVPSAAQIAKIYRDEKVLFQAGAACTLYGTSDAVTALAHDDTTDLLHVGTSAGRSVFDGLRRVSNTTVAVGTAISASNNLIAEE